MTDETRFVKADGTLLTGKDAEVELAKHDAKKILEELGMDGDATAPSKEANKSKEGKGRRLKSGVGPRIATSESQSKSTGTPSSHGGSYVPDSDSEPAPDEGRGRTSKARDEADERKIKKMIVDTCPQIDHDAQEIWKFSKDAEEGVYRFSLDIDTLWKKVTGILNSVQSKINEVASVANCYLDKASGMTDKATDALDTWGDMTENVRKGTEMLNREVKKKTEEVTGFSRNLNERAQNLAKSANSTLKNPMLNNVADLGVVSDTINDMAGTGDYLTSTFNDFVNDQSAKVLDFITTFSKMVTDIGESTGLFGFIKEAASEISKLLKMLSDILKSIKDKVNGFLNKINGLFEKIFTWVAKIRSVIEGVLGLDIELMKEALKNGTIRLADVRVGTMRADFVREVKTKSSTDISAAKVTAGNLSAAGVVRDNSKSGHIEVTAVDVKAANADVAMYREGSFKRNMACLKGAGVNAANVRATLVDNREGDTAVVGASAAEINVGNVEAFGLGRKGTHKQTTVQPSLNVGNVAAGIRRSTGTNMRLGPHFSAFNVDLTVGAPSLSNFLNQLGPGQGFGNIAIPFFGGGGGEAGGKSSGEKSSGMPIETAGDSTYGLARDTVEFGDRLPQDGVKGGEGVVQGPGSTNTGDSRSGLVDHSGDSSSSQRTRSESDPHGSNGGVTQGANNSGSSNSDHEVAFGMAGSGNEPSAFAIGGDISTGKTSDGVSGFGFAKKGSILGSKSEGLFSFPDRNSKGGRSGSEEKAGALTKSPDIFGGGSRSSQDHRSDNKHRGNGSQGSSLEGSSRFSSQSGMSQRHKTSAGDDGREDETTNALGSGVYKSGDGIGRKDEDDYQSRLVALVKGPVQDKVGKKKPEKDKKGKKGEEKPKKMDKEELKRLLLKECQDELELAGGASVQTGSDGDKIQQKAKPKPKAKPWGEHGNIHGFSTLGMESDKEVKKLGDGIYGFADS